MSSASLAPAEAPVWQDLYHTHRTPDPHSLSPVFAERRPISRNVQIGAANVVVLAAGLLTVAIR